jgi:hypothetical protein
MDFDLLGDSEQFLNQTLAAGGGRFASSLNVVTPVANVSDSEAKPTIGNSSLTINQYRFAGN